MPGEGRARMSDVVWAKAITPETLGPVAGLDGRWRRWVAPTPDNRGMIFGMGELAPGEVAGWHAHPEPEVFFVVEGLGEALWREGGVEQRAELHPGVAFFKVGHVPHQMRNLGIVPLRGVFFKVGEA
jgi:quercetin dioxygenase-like cupin family protein